MSKYLKLFETTSQYNEYINGSDAVFPNVSVAKDAPKKVYYNPIPFFVKLSLNNGEMVELQGSGELTQAMITPYKSSLVSAEIGKSCTSIGDRAFYNCTGLTSITIPDSVTSIGEKAFYGCSGLKSITIPDSVTSIGSSAFSTCKSLTSIVVDSANTVYDSRDNCNAIINISTNELVAGCKSTVIPNTVTSIGSAAFSSRTGLTSITIPDSVTSIGNYAFYNCTGLTSVTIGNGVTRISDGAFNKCTGLTSITSLATKAPTIRSTTFQNIKTGGTLTVPDGSTDYNVWMGTGNYYLGKYNWTKTEQ